MLSPAFALQAGGALVREQQFDQTGISKPLLPTERHRYRIALSSDSWTWRETECVPSHLSPERVQLVTCMVTVCGQKIDHLPGT